MCLDMEILKNTVCLTFLTCGFQQKLLSSCTPSSFLSSTGETGLAWILMLRSLLSVCLCFGWDATIIHLGFLPVLVIILLCIHHILTLSASFCSLELKLGILIQYVACNMWYAAKIARHNCVSMIPYIHFSVQWQ